VEGRERNHHPKGTKNYSLLTTSHLGEKRRSSSNRTARRGERRPLLSFFVRRGQKKCHPEPGGSSSSSISKRKKKVTISFAKESRPTIIEKGPCCDANAPPLRLFFRRRRKGDTFCTAHLRKRVNPLIFSGEGKSNLSGSAAGKSETGRSPFRVGGGR